MSSDTWNYNSQMNSKRPEFSISNEQWIIIFLIIPFLLAGCQLQSSTNQMQDVARITFPIGASFPPVATQRDLRFTIKNLQALNIDRVRINGDWFYREPSKGVYDWEALDLRINTFSENGFLIFLTIPANGPDWACGQSTDQGSCAITDEDGFARFVTALVKRYEGKISKYQFGNEWDNGDWFPGSAVEYTRLNNLVYSIVHQYSADSSVVLGGLTSAYPVLTTLCENGQPILFEGMQLKRNVDLEGMIKRKVCTQESLKSRVEYVLKNANYDLVDLHLYDVYGYWPLFVSAITSRTDKPLIVSEFGGPSSEYERYSQAYQAAQLEKYLMTLQTLPIEEAYHFNLVDNPLTYHNHSGLFTVLRIKKDAYFVMEKWLN
ncbi:MAG: hypothetical protein SVR81_10445 [Chloroflexota bacterium]|nr:hypothetical protein [Chloroflexota bacterium]